MTTKKASKPVVRKTMRGRKPQTVGQSIIRGLKEAIAWSEGKNDNAHVTIVNVLRGYF